MKILAVNWLDPANPDAGGAEIHFIEIFRRLVQAGDEVTLVCSGWRDAEPETVIEGVRVRRVGGRHSFALRGRGAVRRILASERFDVVVEDINKLPLYLASVTNLPLYVIVPHLFGAAAFREASWPVASAVWLAERFIPRAYRRAAFQAISRSTRDDLVARGVPEEQVRVIFPGSNPPPPGGKATRAAVPTFLYVGRLRRYKGVHLAVRALAAVRTAHPEARLWIAGTGDARPGLESLVRRLGLDDAVQFFGFVPEGEKWRLLREAWALVFPSEKEGWGIANIEAASCGTPAIASDRPGLRESVRHGETGLLVPHGDVSALAGAMTDLIEHPADLRRMGEAGRAFAAALTWDEAAVQTRQHLMETIDGGRTTES